MPRRAAILATLALALAAGGCNSGAGPSKVVGSTLTVYVGLPLHGSSAPEGQAIENGMKLALAEAGGEANGRKVQATYLDDTKGGQWDQATTADDARRASQDITAIGYLGDLESGATRVSLPITNQAEMMQISPASTAVDLTRAAGGQTPDRLQPSGKRTFARVVPADDVQAHAGAMWAKQLGAKRVITFSDGSEFGDVVAVAFEDAAKKLGLQLVTERAHPQLVYYAGTAEPGAKQLHHAADTFPQAKLMGSDALLAPSFLRDARDLASRLYLTSPFIDPSRLPPAGKKFVADYRARFSAAPDPAAVYGYESMSLLLDAIKRAGKNGDDRERVISGVLATRDRDSVLGRYSIDEFGDTTLDEITGYTVRNGKPAFATELRAPH